MQIESTQDSADRAVLLTLDEKVYPRPVSIAAAYRFIDRCYVRLSRAGRGKLEVRLKAKDEQAEDGLQQLAEEFGNELLQQLMRHQVAEQTSGLREVLVGRALLSAEPVETLGPEPDQPQGEGELDYLDDPLGIAVPWEEKYGDDQGEDEQGS